jgi:hypothetical protein
MFYWLMSWPHRLLTFFGANHEQLVIGLRLVSMAAFVGGLILYRRALLLLGQLPKSAVQGALLVVVLVPAVALLPGTVNYDTFVFLIFGWILLLTVQILQAKRLPLERLSLLAIASLLITVMQWSALALLVPIVVCILLDLFKYRHGRLKQQLKLSYRAIGPWHRALLTAGLLLTFGLFVGRPVMNIVHYGTPQASCQVILGAARCHNNPNYIAYHELALQKPSNFTPMDPVRFFFADWLPIMADKAGNVFEQGTTEIALFKQLSYAITLVWLVLLAITWRELWRNKVYRSLLIIVGTFGLLLFLNEYAGYLRYGVPVAIRPRYLVPVVPLMAYLGTAAAFLLWPKHRGWLIATGICLIFLMTQGGGITTYLITTPTKAYWSGAIQTNNGFRRIVEPLVRH